MKLQAILAVYVKELREAVRDRRTLISVIVIPTVAIPLMFFFVGKAMSRAFSQAQEELPTVMIVGGEDSPGIVATLKSARHPDRDRPLARIVPLGDYTQQITNKQLSVAVEIPAGFEAALQAGGAQKVRLDYFEGEIKSGIAAADLEKFFNEYRRKLVEKRLTDRGLSPTVMTPFTVERKNVAPQQRVDGAKFGGFIPYLIIILCFTGAMYPAMDTTAGEKERGTMETLLCSPVPRLNLVLGKFLLVLTGSLTAIVCSLTSMAVMGVVAGTVFGGGGGPVAAKASTTFTMMPAIDPLGMFGVMAMVLPVAMLFAAVALTISLFAKSMKEAQSYLAPMMFVVVMPAILGLMPGIELTARTALIPIFNLSLVCKEMLSGVWHWNYIALIFGSSALYAGLAFALCVRMFNRESVMFRA
ncbi:ABC transporter permease [Opitutus sp. GAS368]|jgi:sodium transport system permease protein|uniref:ABC transporter permease n=1 Tax=Opitutus sp. GAS368 TaxID=1882749 RepID=UPI00087CBB76|nr:ABC transporter permease [Opitutus sp. GAS368]SDR92123.1 sodium transport system permease protein [Opitutus sp. GAS368]